MSIMPQDPDSKTPPIATLRTVTDRMCRSADEFTVNVGYLADYIATQHEPPVSCDECRDGDSLPCLMYESALSVAFAWLLKVVEERG